ncbi:MAG: hypothetical protein K0R09_302 [Clostridiales bacterium]|jgi:uncharacterized protein YlxW (UPF0749 family)|nr:hypothetical protein [Clostridiales bacterium]
MKKFVSQIWIGLICVILGFMITFQFKANRSTQIKSSSRQYEDMTKEIESLNKQKDELNLVVKEYQDKVDEYEKAVANDSTAAKKMKDELDNLRKLAGLEEDNGPGLEITISPPVDVTQSVYNSIGYDTILMVVNELNSTNEAEAISINGERFTGRTAIREVGNVIKINDNRIDPTQKVVIKAIGNPDLLFSAFSIPGNILESIASNGFIVSRDKKDNVTILKYGKSLDFKYIK